MKTRAFYSTISLLALSATLTACSTTPSALEQSVPRQWDIAIGRLGIQSVYPPTEDFQVGDLLIFRTSDEISDEGSYHLKSAWLARLDLTKELKHYTTNRFVLPETPEPAGEGKIDKQTVGTDIFSQNTPSNRAALTAFPGITIANVRASEFGVGSPVGAFRASLGLAASNADTVVIKVGGTETYGIPLSVADRKLSKFCMIDNRIELDAKFKEGSAMPLPPDMCLQEARKSYVKQLQYKQTESNKNEDGSILLVYRVYLARTIEYEYRLAAGRAFNLNAIGVITDKTKDAFKAKAPDANAKADAAKENETKADAAKADVAKADATKVAANADAIKSLQDSVEQLQKTLTATMSALPSSTPGASVRVSSSSNTSFTLTETFERPLVFGYRAVRLSTTY